MRTVNYIAGLACLTALVALTSASRPYTVSPANDTELYDTIVALDSLFFTAYNTCDLETQAKLISEDLEFYHDMGGLNTSKAELLTAMKTNICGKVRRELVEGSIEVSPIPGFGAVQLGMHKFYNNQEPDAISKPSRFVTLWKKTGDTWQMTRIISLHNN